MTVRELLARVDSRELSEWMAFFRLREKRRTAGANGTAPQKKPDAATLSEQIKAAFKRRGY
ncbi:MAG: hypothetical protein AB7E47_03335 [Desulfovibrionaceae bacterium]